MLHFTRQEELSLKHAELKKRRYQRRMARKQKGSKRYERAKVSYAKHSRKQANIRLDRAHKISTSLVKSDKSVFVLEKLPIQNMTKKTKPKKCEMSGKWLKNNARAKSGLNRAILNSTPSQMLNLLYYKVNRAGKALFLIDPKYTSQTCSSCNSTTKDNRKSQALFECVSCGHTENADTNAAKNIKDISKKLILPQWTKKAPPLGGGGFKQKSFLQRS
jgi:putative transposase